jgi:hypothetical protein
MMRPTTSLAGELVRLYCSGMTVSAIAAATGLSESSIVTRLCAASRGLEKSEWFTLDEDGGLGVQWEFVYWRA